MRARTQAACSAKAGVKARLPRRLQSWQHLKVACLQNLLGVIEAHL